ncbi:hypothetical protein PGT21_033857 [Puccinia graminis f. sp. tritici]|uniref:Uncharacterized protein n=1 Tax=Puccinia graminis f. sp. tritici TaxID=56615 RepID=A0A5B0Q9K8_PUCGR|nr:hypothetical protein PGT21_033857 [Puccinia graminis f. sp. tritici]KAA1109809.1 hypothetical protein PGTUg99_035378 [Puccinia graminis f. sp. tritici]
MLYVHIIISISPPPAPLLSHDPEPDPTREALKKAFESFQVHVMGQLANAQSVKGGRPPNWTTLLWHALEHWIHSDPTYSHLITKSSSLKKPSPDTSSSSDSSQLACQLFLNACFVNSLRLITGRFRQLLRPAR